MKIPPPPKWLPLQRYDGRFWSTERLLELLALHYGVAAVMYPHTWHYRLLILIHRELNTTNAHRKGYGPDWKCLSREEKNARVSWIQDKGFAIKGDVLEYLRLGRIPLQPLKFACKHVREIEMQVYVRARVEQMLFAEAAE